MNKEFDKAKFFFESALKEIEKLNFDKAEEEFLQSLKIILKLEEINRATSLQQDAMGLTITAKGHNPYFLVNKYTPESNTMLTSIRLVV